MAYVEAWAIQLVVSPKNLAGVTIKIAILKIPVSWKSGNLSWLVTYGFILGSRLKPMAPRLVLLNDTDAKGQSDLSDTWLNFFPPERRLGYCSIKNHRKMMIYGDSPMIL